MRVCKNRPRDILKVAVLGLTVKGFIQGYKGLLDWVITACGQKGPVFLVNIGVSMVFQGANF